MSKNNKTNKQNKQNNSGYCKGRYTSYQNKIRLANNDERNTPLDDNEVVLAFPYKDCVLTGGMTKEDKNKNIEERFLHLEIDKKDIDALRDNKVLTNFSVVDINGEKKVTKADQVEFFDEKGNLKNNLLIKGNNLISLYSLREQFVGKIKMIYIDPPYNTGGEANIFTYNNSFNHASWLAFMRNRLEVAKRLLRDDGFIAITIDHAELFYLGVLADEIFERENYITTISILHHPAGRTNDTFFASTNEFMLVYSKDKSKAVLGNFEMSKNIEESFNLEDDISKYKLENIMRKGETRNARREDRPKQFYPIYVSQDLQDISLEKQGGYSEVLPVDKGIEWVWSFSPNTLQEKINAGDIVAKNNGGMSLYLKRRITDYKGQKPRTVWHDARYNAMQYGTKLLEEILGYKPQFSYPKSLYAVLDTLKITTEKDDIILDFFAGSGTTGHATLALNAEDGGNRKFIMCEQIDEHFSVCKERITKVLQKSEDLFNQASDEKVIACELKKYNQEYIDQIRGAKTKDELKKVCKQILSSSHPFLQFDFIKEDFDCDDKTISLEEQKAKLVQVLDVNQLYHNQLDMKDRTHNISQLDQELTNKFYGFE